MSPTTLLTAKSHGLKCVRNRCFTISFPPFLSATSTDRRALARLSSLSWSKTFQVSGQVRERTGPALIHNQLVDRSLQTNVCDETVCAMNAKNYSRSSPGSFPCDRFPLQFGILAGKICYRAPLLQAVIGHAQLEGLNPSFTFVRKLPAQFWSVAVGARLRQEEARPRHG